MRGGRSIRAGPNLCALFWRGSLKTAENKFRGFVSRGCLAWRGGVKPCSISQHSACETIVPVSPLRTSLVGEGKSGLPPAGPVPPAFEGGDGVENNDILRVRP